MKGPSIQRLKRKKIKGKMNTKPMLLAINGENIPENKCT
jgi:hypothetical protein